MVQPICQGLECWDTAPMDSGGMGAQQVQSRSRWSSLRRDVSSQGLKISGDGDPPVLSQFPASDTPSQTQSLKENDKDLRNED